MRKSNQSLRTAWAGILATVAVFLVPGHQLIAQAGTWTARAPMPTARCCVAAATIDGVLYVVGGFADPTGYLSTLEAYDPKTKSWSTKAPMPTRRLYMGGATVGGILYIVGGQSPTDGYLATLEAYDPKTNTWTTEVPMPTPRMGLAVTAVDGLLFALGGDNNSGLLATVEAYDPSTRTWSLRAPMPTPRFHFAAGVVNGVLYAMGGNNVRDGTIRTVEAYDPKTNTWTTKTPMPTARDGLTVAVADGTIYAIGGTDGSMFQTVEAYDPKTDTWTTAPAMPTGRHNLASGVIEDTVYAVGGLGFNCCLGSEPFLAVNEAFSPFLHVGIDIKPGDARNTINLRSRGTLPVAILGSASFDPMTVNPETVTLAGAPVARRGFGVPMTARGDFNHDGYFDLLLHFRTQELELTPSSTEAVLYGETFSGERIRGADSLRLVPLPPPAGASAGQDGNSGPRNHKRR